MRVAVLAYNLIGSGALSVGRNIVALLPKLAPQNEYMIWVPEGLGYPLHKEFKMVTVRPIRRMDLFSRLKYEFCDLPKQVDSFKADVILALGNIGLLKPKCTQAILIHQSHFLYDSKHYGRTLLSERLKIWGVKQWIKCSLRSTKLIFCQTPVMRQKFAEVFHYPLEQIAIAPNAVSEFAKVDKLQIDVPEILKTKKLFTLFLLAYYNPYKNMEVLVELFRQYPMQLQDVRCIITISPEQNSNAKKILETIKKDGLEEKIVNVGPLKQEDLAGYFCHCDAFFFPTLLESFSGTYLEAMHFGLPILTSDLDFAHYVCDDAAVYFDPWNPQEMVEKILEIKESEELRNHLVQKGIQRISKFFKSWEQIVSEMLKEIEKL